VFSVDAGKTYAKSGGGVSMVCSKTGTEKDLHWWVKL
jgi:hypothetical protein